MFYKVAKRLAARERPGVEVPGQPVVALGVFEHRDVEELDEVAVVGGVFELPGAGGEHGVSTRRRAIA